jgi:hypothetical protein
MLDFRKIEDSPGWIKNMENKAILNSNLEALKQHKINKQKKLQFDTMQNDVNNLKNDIQELKCDLSDIKQLLIQFVSNK